MFQSLIGTLQTQVNQRQKTKEAMFQSLIGTLQTRNIILLVVVQSRGFNPS